MKKFEISSRGWVMLALAGLVLMFGAVKVVRERQHGGQVVAGAEGGEIPVNTLTDDTQPPVPEETPLMGGGELVLDGASQQPDPPASSGGGGSGDLPLQLPLPADRPAAGQETTPSARPQQPVVWVSQEGASAYAQPGFNMPKVRPLKKWEELQIVEATQEAWDRVSDEAGQEFWIQKKVVTSIRPQNLSQPSVAEEKVMAFYNQVEEGAHSDAYTLLSPEWKRELSFNDFVTGYSRTDSLRTEIVNVFDLGEDRYQVDVSMEAVEEGDPVDYLGIYQVGKVDGKWYLTSGSLKRQVRAL